MPCNHFGKAMEFLFSEGSHVLGKRWVVGTISEWDLIWVVSRETKRNSKPILGFPFYTNPNRPIAEGGPW